MRFPCGLIPRFRLRTLFVIVTIIALWLGWQIKIVRDREAILKQLDLEGVGIVEVGRIGGKLVPIQRRQSLYPVGMNVARTLMRKGDPTASPNWTRRFLGDPELKSINLGRFESQIDFQRLACFPEADVFAWDTPFNSR